MKALILLLLSLPALAQVASQDIVTLFGGKRGLVRSGLAAAVQTGSTNLVRYSEDFSNAAWVKDNATVSGTRVTLSGTFPSRLFQSVALAAGTYTVTVRAKSFSGANQTFYIRIFDGTGTTWSDALTATSGYQTFTLTRTCTAGTGNVLIGGTTNVDAAVDIDVQYIQLNEGSTALPYVATTDLQSIASIPPGTATITRGANSGASTDDPTVSLAGWNFDSGDRVSGLPAKGSAWTTTNCSGVECYTVDNSVDGEPRRNLLLWSDDFSNAAWMKNAVSVTGTNTIVTTAVGGQRVQQDVSNIPAGTYNFTVRIRGGTATSCKLLLRNMTDSVSLSNSGSVALSSNAVTITVTGTINGTKTLGLYLYVDELAADPAGSTAIVEYAQLELGSTPTAYQRTTVATGREYINGVPRRNLLRWSEDISNAVWTKEDTTTATAVSGGVFTVVLPANNTYGLQQEVPVSASATYTYSVEVQSDAPVTIQVGNIASGSYSNVSVTTDWVRIGVSQIASSATRYPKIRSTGTAQTTIRIRFPQLELGSTALEYQKTTDSREWALETVGNYVGLLTWWDRYSRLLSPGEVLRNYRQYIKPQVNARTGNALP